MKNSVFNVEVAMRVKWLRLRMRYTAAFVADAIGLGISNYSKIENGSRGLTLENCDAISRFYGVSCDFIIRGTYEINAVMFAENNLKKANEMLADISALLCNVGDRMVELDVRSAEEVRS